MRKSRSKGFTLIEVVVAVMIISVVIAALLQAFAHNTRLFSRMEHKIGFSTQASLLLGKGDIGFENMDISLDRVLGDFRMDDEFRRRLKAFEAEIDYREIMRFDGSDFFAEREAMADEEGESLAGQKAPAVTFEIGRTSMRSNGENVSFLRLRL